MPWYSCNNFGNLRKLERSQSIWHQKRLFVWYERKKKSVKSNVRTYLNNFSIKLILKSSNWCLIINYTPALSHLHFWTLHSWGSSPTTFYNATSATAPKTIFPSNFWKMHRLKLRLPSLMLIFWLCRCVRLITRHFWMFLKRYENNHFISIYVYVNVYVNVYFYRLLYVL